MARSIYELGQMAWRQFPPADVRVQEGAYEMWVEEGWRQFVDAVGWGVYQQTAQIPLAIGETQFDLPNDLRQVLSVRLGYLPRTLASLARVSGVVTAVTATEHGLEAGMHVQVLGADPDDFDEPDVAVASVAEDEYGLLTIFTYAQAGDDAVGTGGQVLSVQSSIALAKAENADFPRLPAHERTPSTPSRYYLPMPQVLGLYPPSDGRLYPEVILDYDALAPDTLDRMEPLPVSALAERGLIAYAGAMATGRMELLELFNEAVRQHRRNASIREDRNRGTT
jgi:hypothetical protein